MTRVEADEGGGFRVATSEGPLRARRLVLASGGYQRPHRPVGSRTLPPSVAVLDAQDYTRPDALPPGAVLVVGSGQTGCQLAEELAESGRRVHLACGRAPWIPRRVEERDIVSWLVETTFFAKKVDELPDPGMRLLANPQVSGRDGGHDLNYRTLQALGVVLTGHFLGAEDGRVHFADDLAASVAFGDARHDEIGALLAQCLTERGARAPQLPTVPPFAAEPVAELDLAGVGAVVFTSGYRPDFASWVGFPEAFDAAGFPLQTDGSSTVVPGLHFMGVHWQRTRKSATFLGVAEDAAVLAERMTAGGGRRLVGARKKWWRRRRASFYSVEVLYTVQGGALTVSADVPVTAPAPSDRRPDRWLILAVICLVQLVVILDNTVLNVAVPSLTRELGASTSQTQWVIGAYSLAQAGLLIAAGGFADRYGRKLVQMVGLGFFGLGSLGGALASTPGQLIAARAGMGVGGSLLLATSIALVVRTFDAEEQPKALGATMGVGSLGFALGPIIGGALLAHFWWGSIFLVNLPVCVLGLLAVAKFVPESKDPRGERPDLLGALLSVVGMVAVVYAIIQGPGYGWTSARTLVPAAVGLLFLTGFVLWERRTPHPLLDMAFFHNARFRGAVSGGVLVSFGMGGSLFLLTQHLQFVLGYGPLEAGLRTAPMALTIVLLNLTGAGMRITAKLPAPVAIAGGLSLMAGGLAAIAVLGRNGSYPGILLGLVLMGAGVAAAQPAMAGAVMGSIPPEKAGVGSGLMGTLSELGNSMGVAVLGAVLTAGFAASLPSGVPQDAARSLPGALATAGPSKAAQVVKAFGDSLTSAQLIGAVAVLLGGLLAAWLIGRVATGTQAGGSVPGNAEPEPATAV